MAHLYNILLHQPLLNALVLFYQTIALKDLGLAIILLTLAIRLALWPVFERSVRHQTVMQNLQPHIKKIQETHRKDKEKQAKEMMALYKTNKINPFSGFLFLIIQLPILIALYRIFLSSLSPEVFGKDLYSFVGLPAQFSTLFLGLIRLDVPNIIMVGLAAVAQYFQARLSLPKQSGAGEPTQAEKMGRTMAYIGPVITLLIFYRLPAAVALYWLTTSIFSIFQQMLVNKKLAHGQPRTLHQTNT